MLKLRAGAVVVLSLVLGGSLASAATVTWPATDADWNPLFWNGVKYADALGDETPVWVDIVGSTTYPAGFWYISEEGTPLDLSDDMLMFRMRLNQIGVNGGGNDRQSVWQVLFDTDSDGGANFCLQVDGKTDKDVQFVATLTSGPPFSLPPGPNPVTLSTTNIWFSTDLATYRRWSTAGDGSNFGGDADTFLDMAMPWPVFATNTGLSQTDTLYVTLCTSASHEVINKDHPDSQLYGSSSPPPTGQIPEPATVLSVLAGLGLVGRVLRRRRA
jgi:hypothetical protein